MLPFDAKENSSEALAELQMDRDIVCSPQIGRTYHILAIQHVMISNLGHE